MVLKTQKKLPELVPVNQDCSSAIDEANTLRQELGSLIVDLRRYANHLRDDEAYEIVANTIEEIISG